MALPAIEAKIREHGRLVNESLARYLPPESIGSRFSQSLREYLAFGGRRLRPSLAMYEPMRHVVEAGGKRIRPTLCLLACEAVGGRAEQALPSAVGIEFLHTFTLVHDDIMDKALVRRGHPTVGALWGDDVAITVGDGLFALAFRAFADNARVEGVSAERAMRVVERASDTSLALARGQTMDLLLAQSPEVSVADYLEMIRLKTGVLLEFSLEAGARLGGASEATVAGIAALGAPLGMAFQIRDDVLDLTGDAKTLGKPVGGDVRTGKRTLMVAHALQNAADPKRLVAILDKPTEETTEAEVLEAIRILERAGSIEFAKKTAERYLVETKSALAAIPRTPGAASLEALAQVADFILHRES